MSTKEKEVENEPKPQPTSEGQQGVQGAEGDVGGSAPDTDEEV